VFEIGTAAQPADEKARALAFGDGDDQVSEGDALELAARRAGNRRAGVLQHREPLLDGKQRRLAGMGPDRKQQTVSEPRRLAHDVEMAVGDGIERTWKERGARHARGLTRPAPTRQVPMPPLGKNSAAI